MKEDKESQGVWYGKCKEEHEGLVNDIRTISEFIKWLTISNR